MSLEEIPSHYLIMHQFLYQAEAPMKGEYEDGAVSHTGRTRKTAEELKSLGWRRADYNRETLDDEGNPVIKRRVNQDSFWYRPEHWSKDPDVYPPVNPKSPAAEEFFRTIRRGRRMTYPQAVKEEIMDALVSFMSDGRISQWYGGAGGHERMKNKKGRLDRPQDVPVELPAGVDEQLLIPRAAFLAFATRLGPEGQDIATRGMEKFGWSRASIGNRDKEVWYNPKHWEAMIGGDFGLMPISPEAEEYEKGLDPNKVGTPTRRYLPDISLMSDIEIIVKAAYEAGKTGQGTPGNVPSGNRPPPKHKTHTFRQSMSSDEKGWVKDPTLDDIDAATANPPKHGRGDLPGQPPKPTAGMKKKSSTAPASKVRFADDDEDDDEDIDDEDDDDLDDDEDEDDIDDDEEDKPSPTPGKKMTAAELDAAANARWEKFKQGSGKRSAPKEPAPPKKTSVVFADDDDEDDS